MKKQIFKLTSILLAMVMVFSLFSIIPISAEGVDKAAAVFTLKNAWKALDYNSYMAKTVFNYCKVGAADATWDAAALTPALDAPDDAACTNNYVYNLAGSSSNNPVKVAALPSTDATSPIMPYDINEVDDMYFYYKTDDATEITTKLDFRKTDSTGTALTDSGFNGTKNIPGTSGKWVKFSFNDYLALFGVTFSSRIINNGNAAHNLISCFGFALYTTSDTTISISNLFIDGDPNVAEARNFTDDEWIAKVVDTDLTELKAQYNDPEDSATWTAFVDAFNVVKDSFGAEVCEAALRAAAEKMITSTTSYAYPIQQGRNDYSSLMTATNSSVSEFGKYYRELTLPNYGKAINASIGANSIWLQTKYVSGNDNLRFGDMGTNPYINVEVISTGTASVAHLGFFGRMLVSGTEKNLTSSYTKEVVKGNTYKIYLDDVLTGFGSDFDNWKTDTKSTGNIYGGLFVIGSTDADVTLKVGSIVSETNYEITSTKTGADFVAEMINLDISKLGNTEKFVAALEAAKKVFPNAEKLAAVENLRTAAGKMVKSNTSFLYPANKNSNGVLTMNAVTGDDKLVYGDYTTTHTFDGVSTIKLGNGIWFAPDTTSGGKTAKYIGEYADAYLTVNVESAAAGAKLGFWMRTFDSVGEQYDIASNHTVAVESGKTYTIPMADFFDDMAHTNTAYNDMINGWREYSLSTATTNKFNATIFCLVATGAVTATVGSVVDTKNYKITSDKTGEDFVAEMLTLKESDEYASFINTADFEAALDAALELYPDTAIDSILKKAYNKIAVATDIPVSAEGTNSLFYPARFNNGSSATYHDSVGSWFKLSDSDGISIAENYAKWSLTNASASWWQIFETYANKSDGTQGDTINNIAAGYGLFADFDDLIVFYKTANVTRNGNITVKIDLNGNTSTALEGTIPVDSSVSSWKAVSLAELAGSKWKNWKTTAGTRFSRVIVYPSAGLSADVYVSDMVVVKYSALPENWNTMTVKEKLTSAYNTKVALENNQIEAYDTADFVSSFNAAIEFNAEFKAEVELADTARDLKNTWKNLTYIPKVLNTASLIEYAHGGSGGGEYKLIFSDDTSAETKDSYVDSVSTDFGTAYKFPYVEELLDKSGNPTSYEHFKWRNPGSTIASNKSRVSSIGVWYKTTETLNKVRVTISDVNLSGDAGVLPSTNDQWKFITIKDILGDAKWQAIMNDASITAFDQIHFMFVSPMDSRREAEISFGDLVVYDNDAAIKGIDTWSNEELAFNADKADLDAYEANAELKTQFGTLSAKLAEAYAEEIAAQYVIDASKSLDKLALKPNAYTFGGNTNPYATVYKTSNKGDAFISFNNSEVGAADCKYSYGYVEYNTDKPVTLADVEDLYFSYKVNDFKAAEGVEDGYVAARFYIFNDDFGFDKYTNEAGEEVAGVSDWSCGFSNIKSAQAYFRIDKNTGDEWVTTSIAEHMGSDWKTSLLTELNKSKNPNRPGEFTEANVKLSAIRLGFNHKYGTADISLGSMYAVPTNANNYITATYSDPATVLEQARDIDLSNVNAAQANAFKKLVKTLENTIEAAAVETDHAAGNYGAEVSIVDLSVISRYVYGELGDTFIDLDAADIDGKDEVNEADVIALRKKLLGIPDES